MFRSLSLVSLALLVESCRYQCGDAQCFFSMEEWDQVETMSPLPTLTPDPTNRFSMNDQAAAFGQRMFYEKAFSSKPKIPDDGTNGGFPADESGNIGCYACHIPDAYFMDTRSIPGNVSLGITYTERNTPSLVNVAHYRYNGWGGKQDSIWCQAATSFESGTNSAGNRCGLAHTLFKKHRAEYDALFETPLPTALSTSAPDASRFPASCKPKKKDAPDGAWENMTEDDRNIVMDIVGNQGKAIAAYEEKLVSGPSPFDLYVAGDMSMLSDSAKRGLKLFMGKAACSDCHIGAIFSDNKFHNLGVPQEGPNLPASDIGRFLDIDNLKKHEFNSLTRFNDGPDPGDIPEDLLPVDGDKGKLKTPMLRNVALTAPYMHNGLFETLHEVVEFYNEGGGDNEFSATKSPALVPLGLSSTEIDDLVAFLESLTGDPVPEELRTNPFE